MGHETWTGVAVTPFGKGGTPHADLTMKPAWELAIQDKFASLGGTAVLGDPVRKEERIWTFSGGSCVCYNAVAAAAFEVHGAIYASWKGLGREKSYLGWPTSDEVEFPQGGRASGFEHGGIYWWADTGAIDLRDVVLSYAGVYCFGKTDWDQGPGDDEPYVILSATTPTVALTHRTSIEEKVHPGIARPAWTEIYRGPPYGINIGAILMEYDFGDPDKYKEQVQALVNGVHAAGTLALGAIPVVGPGIALVVGPALGSLMPKIGGAVNDLFDWGDDRIDGWVRTIPAREMVLLGARNTERAFHGIVYEIESDLLSGSGASYKVYFTLAPVSI